MPAFNLQIDPDGLAILTFDLPGEKVNNFEGTGWTLTGGARVVKASIADGTMKNAIRQPTLMGRTLGFSRTIDAAAPIIAPAQ